MVKTIAMDGMVIHFTVIYTSNGTCDREVSFKEVQALYATGI